MKNDTKTLHTQVEQYGQYGNRSRTWDTKNGKERKLIAELLGDMGDIGVDISNEINRRLYAQIKPLALAAA